MADQIVLLFFELPWLLILNGALPEAEESLCTRDLSGIFHPTILAILRDHEVVCEQLVRCLYRKVLDGSRSGMPVLLHLPELRLTDPVGDLHDPPD